MTTRKLKHADGIEGPTFNACFPYSINGKDQECNSLVNNYEGDVGKKHPQDLELSDIFITIPRFVQCYSKPNIAHCMGRSKHKKACPFELLNDFCPKKQEKFIQELWLNFCYVQENMLLTSKNFCEDVINSMKQPKDLIATGRCTCRQTHIALKRGQFV